MRFHSAIIFAWLGCATAAVAQRKAALTGTSAHETQITFNRDISPIIFRHCAGCHHPGESAPFSLLTYAEVCKHTKTIVQATQNRYMPPWLPEKGFGDFKGERRLTDDQIELIRRLGDQGSVEGTPADLPAPPSFPSGWKLGPPDLGYLEALRGRAPEARAAYEKALQLDPDDSIVRDLLRRFRQQNPPPRMNEGASPRSLSK